MSSAINQYISENNINAALEQCLREQEYNLGILLYHIYGQNDTNTEKNRLFVQLNDALNSITKDGKILEDVENVVNENNPSLIEDVGEDIIDNDIPIIEIEKNKKNEEIQDKTIRVMLLCNWAESERICHIWNKMSKGNYRWNNIEIVWEEPCDYFVVINCPPITIFPNLKNTILFHMEPLMAQYPEMWGDWGKPPKQDFLYCATHDTDYNNTEWHISKTYTELCTEKIVKSKELDGVISAVLSDKYKDPGHIRRIDFAKFLDRKGVKFHVFGGSKFDWNDYKGPLPLHQKDNAMLPYKYVFNAENHEIPNYFTEKLVDGILSECLVFYWGCANIRNFFDERAFVMLSLEDFDADLAIIEQAINENWWEQRLPYILEAKKKILEYYQFFPRLERILSR